VADETRIAKRFLAALEAEDFTVFPADPYALGFLRNYAEYLGLDGNELAAAFRTLRIQEQPVPLQELIPAAKPNPLWFAAGGGALLVLVIGAFLVFGRGNSSSGATVIAAPSAPVEYRMEGASLERRLYKGDSIIARIGEDNWKITLSRLDEGATFDTPLGQRRLSLGEETIIDFNKDGQSDLKILLTDLDKKNPARGANLRFTLLGASASPGSTATADAGIPSAAPAAPATPVAATNLPPPPARSDAATTATREGTIFEAAKSPWPFVVSVTFRGSCMFRYEVDKRDRDERYYQKGDTISINANNAVKLWASNAQSAAVVVQASGGKTAEIDLGNSGEIAVKRIAWIQTDSGSYALSLFEVD
jgi:hypothetical protein